MARQRNRTTKRIKDLSKGFVYYDYLGRTPDIPANLALRQHMISVTQTLDTNVEQNLDQYVDKILALAQSERSKENALIYKLTNGQVDMDNILSETGSPEEAIIQLNDCINRLLNIRDIYNRNRNLITNTQGQASIISTFMDYFAKRWNHGNSMRSFKKQLTNFISKNGVDEAQIKQMIAERIKTCVSDALNNMFKGKNAGGAGLESGIAPANAKEATTYEDAYRVLLDEIGQFKDYNSLSNLIYRSLNMDSMVDKLFDTVNLNVDSVSIGNVRYTPAVMYQTKGYTHEVLTTKVLEKAVKALDSNSQSVWTGSANAKVDSALIVGINDKAFEAEAKKVFSTITGGDKRKKNIEMFSQLDQQLQQLNDGFLVYISSKNQGGKSFIGFQAEKINLRTLGEILPSKNILSIVGTIVQHIPGAILGGEPIPENITQVIASYVANFLFDDEFQEVSGYTQGSGAAIHVMDFNGVYMPLSSILFLLAMAMREEIDYDFKSIVNIKYKLPKSILYTEDEWENVIETPEDSHAAWEEQRQEALNKSSIQVNILRSFKSLVNQYTSYI